MKYAFNRLLRDRSGTTSFEILLVFFAFFFIFLATADLARFYFTVHSLRTLVNEMARETIVYCEVSQASIAATCSLPATNTGSFTQSVATAEAVVLLATGDYASATAQRGAADNNGAMLVTASAAYNFNFMVVPWRGTRTSISQTVSLTY